MKKNQFHMYYKIWDMYRNTLIAHLQNRFSHVNCRAFSFHFCHSFPPSLLPLFFPPSSRCWVFCMRGRKTNREGRDSVSASTTVWLCVTVCVTVCVFLLKCEGEAERERERCRCLAQREERDLVDLSRAFMSHFCPEDVTSVSLSGKEPGSWNGISENSSLLNSWSNIPPAASPSRKEEGLKSRKTENFNLCLLQKVKRRGRLVHVGLSDDWGRTQKIYTYNYTVSVLFEGKAKSREEIIGEGRRE